jgi:hypothetical protein
MEPDENSINLSMDEYSRMQTDMLDLKHENGRLKESSEKYEELLLSFKTISEENLQLKASIKEDSAKKLPKFSREVVLDCLKSVRKQDDIEKDQILIIEQVLAIVEYIWPKGGEAEYKVSDLNDSTVHIENKLIKESNQKIKVSLEALEQKCKAMESSLEQTAKDNLTMTQKIAELETHKEHLILDLASREEELGEARKSLKDKFNLECTKHDLEIELENFKSLHEKLKKQLENTEDPQVANEKLKSLEKALEDTKNNENLLTLEYSNLKNSAKQTLQELATLKNSLKDSELSLKSSEEQIKKFQIELEDMKTERQIIQKRSMNDLKELKSELAKEKNLHELCKMDKEKVMQENRKLQENLRAGVKLAPLTHQEKILVESMSHRLSELQQENFNLKNKINEISSLAIENQKILAENEDLKGEINRLQMDIAMMGAQFNELLRKAISK